MAQRSAFDVEARNRDRQPETPGPGRARIQVQDAIAFVCVRLV
jgi:hypothetical protein